MTPLAFLVLAAQVGATVPGTVPSRGRYSPQCSGVRVTASDSMVPPTNMTFSSRDILDLTLRPRVRRVPEGDHLMELKVFTPSGFLYQSLTVPFAGGAVPATDGPHAAAPQLRPVPGYPRPLEVQRLVPVRSSGRPEYELGVRLPVAGTSITQSSLYGTWSVQAFLDGQAEPCGPPTRFTIRD
jgi:hypothetical protein